MKQILLIIGLSILVVAVSQILGMTSARAQAQSGHQTLTTIEDKFGETALIKAVADENSQEMNSLLKAKVDVNVKDKAGNTALFYAVSNGSEKMTKELLKAKASTKFLYGDAQENILFAATRVDNVAIAKALVQADRSLLKGLNKNGENMLFEAARIGASKVTRYLVSLGVNAKLANSQGKTALQIAKENGLDLTVKEMQKSK